MALTSGIKHWGLSGYASVLPRIKFSVTGQDSSPQSPTISYRRPLGVNLKRKRTFAVFQANHKIMKFATTNPKPCFILNTDTETQFFSERTEANKYFVCKRMYIFLSFKSLKTKAKQIMLFNFNCKSEIRIAIPVKIV